MKKIWLVVPVIVALILFLFAFGVAHAGNKAPEPPVHKASRETQAQEQSQKATADAKASAQAGSVATGGGGGAGGFGGGGVGTVGGDSFNSNAWALYLAPLAHTPPMAPIAGCAAHIKQNSWGVGGGLLASAASSEADPTDCTLITLHNSYLAECQYKSAKQIKDLMTRKHLPDFAPSSAVYTDYDPAVCAMFKAPSPPPPGVVNFINVTPSAAEEKKSSVDPVIEEIKKPCTPGMRRNSKGICYKPAPPKPLCPEGKKPVRECVPA
jgi:hypothetical protein